ncbi:unnamed protein product [Paramecium sonneborni]|uniref:Uncharacterized protein n=1 Tax=Paramecium sonneborni TaxID=65129 RepID=A0A8S1QZ43_9CILI|nr:unnamed protein product [Paramecium sonneborni]
MIQIKFPQLNNHNYQITNPNYEKSMKFYLDEALKYFKDPIPKEVNYILTINDQSQDLNKDLANLQINKASRIQILFSIEIQLKITFQTQNDKIVIEFNSYNPISQLEKNLKKTHNLFSYGLNFFYKNNLLSKDKSFVQQQIQKDCEIQCQIIGTYLINYKGDNQVQINIFSKLTQVYQQIKKLFNIEQEFELYYQEELLNCEEKNRDILFFEYQIKPYSLIRLKLKETITIKLYIEKLQLLKQYKVSQDLKFSELKNKLIEENQIDKHLSYSFFIQNQKISDDDLISEQYKQYKNQIFNLKTVDERIKFYICEKSLNSFKIRVCMNQNQKIQDLSNLQQFKEFEHRFYYQNQVLNTSQTFKQINLKNFDIIYYEIDLTDENQNLNLDDEFLVFNEVIKLKFEKFNSNLIYCDDFSIYITFDQIKKAVGRNLEINDLSKMMIIYKSQLVPMNVKIIDLKIKPNDNLVVQEWNQQQEIKQLESNKKNS